MAGQPLRRQWPGNQLGLKAKMKPPSPCGYTGKLMEMYYPIGRVNLRVAFDNEESRYRYTYRLTESMTDEALTYWKVGDYFYLVIGVDDDGKEYIERCQSAKKHDLQMYNDSLDFMTE